MTSHADAGPLAVPRPGPDYAFLLMNSNSDLAGGAYLAAGRDRALCQNGYQVSAVFSIRVMIVVKLVDGDTNFRNGAG